MPTWFPSDVEGERAVGADLTFVDDAQRAAAREAGEPTRDDGPMFRGTVVVWDPPKVFSFTWGGELLRFELLPDGDGTVLVFTHLLSHQSIAARNGSGWHMCLAGLDDLLGAASPDEAPDWREVYDDYVGRMGPALGVPSAGGGMTWERSTHVGPDRVRAATGEEMKAWGGGDRAAEPLRWEVEPTAQGTLYRLTHDAVAGDAELAAGWHALLVQLEMYMAAGRLVPVGHERWIPAYEDVLR